MLKIKLAGRIGWNKSSDLLEQLLPDDAADAWADWEAKSTQELGKKAEARAEKLETRQAKAAQKVSKGKKADPSK